MLVENNKKYSRVRFDDYLNRTKFRIITEDDNEGHGHNIDVYTTDDCKENVIKVILSRLQSNVIDCELYHWTSREQDDKTSRLLNDWLVTL